MTDNNAPTATLPLAIGGVLRCCIATFQRTAPSADVTSEGDTLDCDHCESRLIVLGGVWRWDREHDGLPPLELLP